MSEQRPTVAVIGGTGNLGQGLAFQLTQRGYPVVIGSRKADKAEESARELAERTGSEIRGLDNAAAAEAAEIVIMTVPWAHHQGTLETIREGVQGKIFVDTTVPLVPPKVARVQLPEGGTAAAQAQEFLGENVRVVSAFQNVAAAHLQDDTDHHDCDVLVCGNDKEARAVVVRLAEEIGLRAWHAGSIYNSAVAESLTSVLIFMNRFYKINGAGIQITGEPGEAA
ncbi:NADPH-dependent F420 reductase [Elongatibacter sediminis]|uniref:NADPH-dependent F420 reductase n=1 Tax=Elongatibacter sediminis TaxID=3119006 RepID=A0AAW9RHV7_9GAMM